MSDSNLDFDPAAASLANEEVTQARRDAEAAMSAGDMDLNALFSQESEEKGPGHRVFGHMHIRAALLALPKIGEAKADRILSDLGIAHDTHLAQLGVDQRRMLLQEINNNQ